MDASVNIDQLKIRLLIICKSKNQFEGVANYLIRRGWETTISTSIKEAFKTISVFKPDFVLVSVNVPTPKIAQLPMVITQTFKANTILFCETSDAKSMKLLQTIEASYKIMGSASGPSVHRRVKQILQEIHQPKAAVEKRNSGDTKGDGPDAVVIKGSIASGENSTFKMDGGTIIQKGATLSGSANSNSTMFHMGKEMGARDNRLSSDSDIGSGPESAGDELMALAASFQEAELPDEESSEDLELKKPDVSTDRTRLSTAGRADEGSEDDGSGFPSNVIVGRENDLKPELSAEEDANPHAQPNDNVANGPARAKESERMPADLERHNSESGKHEKTATAEAPATHDAAPVPNIASSGDIFAKVLEIAKACVLPEATPSAVHETISEIITIPIRKSGTNTYLVLAGLGAVEEELHFCSLFIPRMKNDLTIEFPGLEVGESQRIEFELFSTQEPIAGELKTFRVKNGAGEILIKFIEEAAHEAQVRSTGAGFKAEIDPNDLVPNAAVGVAVFLYLEKNNKHYLYLKPRSRISEKQKLRLISEKSKLFINKNDANMYRAVLRKNKTFEAFYNPPKRSNKAA